MLEATHSSHGGSEASHTAVITISGIELAEKIETRQFNTGKRGGYTATMMTPHWNATLAA